MKPKRLLRPVVTALFISAGIALIPTAGAFAADESADHRSGGEASRSALLEEAPLASAAYKSPKRVGRYLTNKFFHLLVAKNRRGLRKFLAKGFQIERADGTGITGAKNYIADLPNVKRFRLSGFRASRSGRVLMVRYYSQATESLNQAPITTSKAPRLSTFIWSGKRWRMTSHSNFAVLPK
jgi:hypothetical protein